MLYVVEPPSWRLRREMGWPEKRRAVRVGDSLPFETGALVCRKGDHRHVGRYAACIDGWLGVVYWHEPGCKRGWREEVPNIELERAP